jgi:ABC-2 type transport system permease protein
MLQTYSITFISHLRVAWALAVYDFKLRYHASILGYVWSWIKPLVIFGVLYLVFSSFIIPKAQGSSQYALQLFLGIMIFSCFSEGTTAGVNALISKSYLVTRTKLPRWIIIVSTTLTSLFNFVIQLGVLGIFFYVQGVEVTLKSLLYVIPLVFLLVSIIMTIAFFLAPFAVRYRDMSMIWDVLREVLFYATPIIYPLAVLPIYMQEIILYNPIGYLVYWSQQTIIHQTYPTMGSLCGMCLLMGAMVSITYVLFNKKSRCIAEYV